MMRRFIDDHGPGLFFQFFQDPLAFFFITFFCRQKCLKTEPSGWKPGHGKGGDTGCRSWKGSDRNTCFIALSYQFFSRIGNSRCSSTRRKSWPTAPLAPTIATFIILKTFKQETFPRGKPFIKNVSIYCFGKNNDFFS